LLLPEQCLAQRLRGRVSNFVHGRPEPVVRYVIVPGPVYTAPGEVTVRSYPTYRSEPAPADEYVGPPPRDITVRPAANDTSRPEAGSATILLNLPAADADVWVQGKRLEGTGTSRRFDTPPLADGEKYSYEFKAQWSRGGREVTQTRTVKVFAGDRVTLDFDRPTAAEPATEIVPREYREPGK